MIFQKKVIIMAKNKIDYDLDPDVRDELYEKYLSKLTKQEMADLIEGFMASNGILDPEGFLQRVLDTTKKHRKELRNTKGGNNE